MRRPKMLQLTIVFIALLTLAGCTSPTKVEGLSDQVRKIKQDPNGYKEQEVTIVGYFRAQDALDEVKPGFPPKDARKDWVIKDNSGAIYVAASNLLPFSPSSQDVWRIMQVNGTIQVQESTNGSMPYIVPKTIEWQSAHYEYDVLPANAMIAIHRFEGRDALNQHIFIYEDRKAVIFDVKTGYRGLLKLNRADFDEWMKRWNKVKFESLPETVGEPCADCIRYHIAAVDSKKQIPHYVNGYEGSLPQALATFVEMVVAQASDAKPISETQFGTGN